MASGSVTFEYGTQNSHLMWYKGIPYFLPTMALVMFRLLQMPLPAVATFITQPRYLSSTESY